MHSLLQASGRVLVSASGRFPPTLSERAFQIFVPSVSSPDVVFFDSQTLKVPASALDGTSCSSIGFEQPLGWTSRDEPWKTFLNRMMRQRMGWLSDMTGVIDANGRGE